MTIAQYEIIDGETQRVLMSHGYQHVHLIRPSYGKEIYTGDIPVRYITYGWDDGDTVYHFRDELPSVRNQLIPAGYLQNTDGGWILSHTYVLQISSDPNTEISEPDSWTDQKRILQAICNVKFVYRSEFRSSGRHMQFAVWRPTATLYILCETEADLISAKMIFGEGVNFTGHNY